MNEEGEQFGEEDDVERFGGGRTETRVASVRYQRRCIII